MSHHSAITDCKLILLQPEQYADSDIAGCSNAVLRKSTVLDWRCL
jgi:hypothetical protein